MLESLMISGSEVWQNIAGVFTQFHWTFILEFLVLAFMIYWVFKTLHESNAGRLIFVYIFLLVAVGIVALFQEEFTASGLFLFITLVSAFFLLLFNIEIKRGIYKGARAQKSDKNLSAKKSGAEFHAEECITGIVKAVQSLSKNNTGALIVLSNGNLPREIVESGVGLNAKISNQLIEGIFINKAPLHDGAMIILGDKIQAAGCFLPLTQRDFPKDYGTRHRAGIGVTEVADVSTIIVSEETGIVSVVRRGDITRYVDSETLKKFLRDYYWKDFDAEKK
ncbi:MAG: diadenylate cyclase [Clostridia bacterium]|nr:diadenylate cyclase [Clostridia bacterium]